MRTHNNLYFYVANFYALDLAFKKARRGKKLTQAYLEFNFKLNDNLIVLEGKLLQDKYVTGPYTSFLVHEPKVRKITALQNFEDRVLQHAVMSVLEPLWEPSFIYDSYACRIGKGTHAGADRAQFFLQECLGKHGRIYVLKADVRKYFASIDHAVLKKLIRRKIADKHLLALLDEIIDSYHEEGKPGKGIPIGNITSQLFANIILDALDHLVKARMGEKWYVRYMDDFLIVHPDKQHLKRRLQEVEDFLEGTLKLELNHKTGIFPVSPTNGQGVDFLGYHLWPHKRRLRKSSLCRYKKRVRHLQRQYAKGKIGFEDMRPHIASWVAHSKHGDAYVAISKYLYSRPFARNDEDFDFYIHEYDYPSGPEFEVEEDFPAVYLEQAA